MSSSSSIPKTNIEQYYIMLNAAKAIKEKEGIKAAVHSMKVFASELKEKREQQAASDEKVFKKPASKKLFSKKPVTKKPSAEMPTIDETIDE